MSDAVARGRPPNRHRGEIAATLDGVPRILCLTLGALAELETAFEVDDLGSLVERFSDGRISAGDAAVILAAGLRGGGTDATATEVTAMRLEGGAAAGVSLCAELLSATFGKAD